MKRFIITTLAITALALGLVAGGNWLVNPYLVFDSPAIPGVNALITENYYKQLLFKPHQLRRIQPRSLVLGTSHAGIGFDPDLLEQPAYNIAIGGSSMYLNSRLLQEAFTSTSPPHTVILETAFFSFNAADPNNTPGHIPDFEQRLHVTHDGSWNYRQPLQAVDDMTASLLSWDVTRASLRTLLKQGRVASHRKGSFIQGRNGQWFQQSPPNTPTHALFEGSWKKYLYDEWFPAPEHVFNLPADTHSGPYADLRHSLELLYAHDTRTILVIAPQHGSLLIALHDTGLWPTFNQWKRDLVTINAETAAAAGKSPFPILDYSVIDRYTSEAMPDSRNSTERLHYFTDAGHVTSEYGRQLMRELLSGDATQERRLQRDTLDEKLLRAEQDLMQYRQQHPELVAELDTLINAEQKSGSE